MKKKQLEQKNRKWNGEKNEKWPTIIKIFSFVIPRFHDPLVQLINNLQIRNPRMISSMDIFFEDPDFSGFVQVGLI